MELFKGGLFLVSMELTWSSCVVKALFKANVYIQQRGKQRTIKNNWVFASGEDVDNGSFVICQQKKRSFLTALQIAKSVCFSNL